MTKTPPIATALFVSALLVNPAFADTKIPQKYNVGGYIDVAGSSNYALGAHSAPRPLPRAPDLLITDKAAKYMATYGETTGLMLIDHGKVAFETYQGMGGKDREFFSMSMAKSLTSLTIGKALCNGVLTGLDQRAGDIVADLNTNNLGKSTLLHLLTMNSGTYRAQNAGQPRFRGGLGKRPVSGKPFAGMHWPIRLGQITVGDILWGPGWDKVEGKNPHPPGHGFSYKGADTLALGVVLQRAAGISLAEYFDRHIWQHVRPAGAAHWESDRTGVTVASSGFQARLTDWGRLAIWILAELKKHGCYGDYLRAATSKQVATDGPLKQIFGGYGYQWWTDNVLAPGFWALGYAGQNFGIDPKRDRIIIKFSSATSAPAQRALYDLFSDWNKTD